jgi:hypothetical protein
LQLVTIRFSATASGSKQNWSSFQCSDSDSRSLSTSKATDLVWLYSNFQCSDSDSRSLSTSNATDLVWLYSNFQCSDSDSRSLSTSSATDLVWLYSNLHFLKHTQAIEQGVQGVQALPWVEKEERDGDKGMQQEASSGGESWSDEVDAECLN